MNDRVRQLEQAKAALADAATEKARMTIELAKKTAELDERTAKYVGGG